MEKYSPYSGLKLFYHTDRINGLIKGERVAPVYIRIKPTNVCNQNCFYCGYANNRIFEDRKVDSRESIPWERLRQVLLDLSEMGVKAVTYSGGGEPLAYHSINQALELTRELGLDYSVITNAQALKGEAASALKGAKWIRVSFDSANRSTYESTRGVSTYDRVVENIANFAAMKAAGCTLGINCVVSTQNAQEVYEICRLVKKLGADNIKLDPIRVKEDMAAYHKAIRESVCGQIVKAKRQLEDEAFKIVDNYTDNIELGGEYQKGYEVCRIQELFAVIAADSKVYRCHQRAYMKPGEIGDLSKRSFKDIWYSQETIDNVRAFDPQKECTFKCAFDERNALLNDFMNMDRNHVNFI